MYSITLPEVAICLAVLCLYMEGIASNFSKSKRDRDLLHMNRLSTISVRLEDSYPIESVLTNDDDASTNNCHVFQVAPRGCGSSRRVLISGRRWAFRHCRCPSSLCRELGAPLSKDRIEKDIDPSLK